MTVFYEHSNELSSFMKARHTLTNSANTGFSRMTLLHRDRLLRCPVSYLNVFNLSLTFYLCSVNLSKFCKVHKNKRFQSCPSEIVYLCIRKRVSFLISFISNTGLVTNLKTEELNRKFST
jgi:hypothetical protein